MSARHGQARLATSERRLLAGRVHAVPEADIPAAMKQVGSMEGIAICPETAACVVAARMLADDGRLRSDERVVIFNTGAPLQYGAGPLNLPRLAPDSVDYSKL